MKRRRQFTIFVNAEEQARIEKDAAGCGLEPSSYIKMLALGQIGEQIGEQPGERIKGTRPLKNSELGLLKKFELLALLTDDELLRIVNKLHVKKFRKNEIVLVEEDSNSFMYVIFDGGVKVTRTSEDGKEIILAMHKKGDFFGEMSLIDGGVISATVATTEDSLIALISRDDFYSLLYSEEKVLLSLLRNFCRRMRASNKAIEILNCTSALQRIKALFLVLSNKYGVASGDGIVLNVQITHRDIGAMTGLTRETVTKIMNELKESGHITVVADKLVRLSRRFINSAM